MIALRIQYFALLAEQSGCNEESLEVESNSLRALYRLLQQRYRFQFSPQHVRPVCNDALVNWEHPLQNGDVVAFLPPFSGG